MADLVPAGQARASSLLAPFTHSSGGSLLARLRAFTAQDPVRRVLPWFGGLAGLGLLALAWATLVPAPQRILYSQLDDGERAKVTTALEKSGIAYRINSDTGVLTVAEDDLYKARMLVAEDGALAAPSEGSGLEKLPMGASRTMEAEHLRAQREHDLTLSIMEIDGIEAVRVHLAEAEKSVFVRDAVAPSASVMVRLVRGRTLADSQVSAIVNLVAGSVPGLSPDAVQVVDHHGRLLTQKGSGSSERLQLQGQMEDKLRSQVDALLAPILGEGNFSSEVQVDLDMDQITSARESYDKNGVLRSESQAASQSSNGTAGAVGVPGVLSNTPPPQTTASPGPPKGTANPSPAATSPVSGESSSTRNYELGREVSVANGAPGKIRRLSVAVALSSAAMQKAKPQDIEQIKQLVAAAVGVDPQRGDQVSVIVRTFDAPPIATLPFYQQGWFLTLVRYTMALIGVLAVLMLGVRPLIKALKREPGAANAAQAAPPSSAASASAKAPVSLPVDAALLGRQVAMAQSVVEERPDSAVQALRDMLSPSAESDA